MKKTFSLLLVIVLLLLTACGAQPEAAPSLSETPSVSPSPSETPSVSETPSETPSATKVSFTTGLPSEADYKPVGVMIENSPAARPQTNLQKADIVYEALAESSITRFFCIFNDNIPDTVGPVRSLRRYYMNIQKEWDCILCHWGGAKTPESSVYLKDSEYIKLRFDFQKGIITKEGKKIGSTNGISWRAKDRVAPHNAYINLQKVQALYDYTPNAREPWKFDANVNYANGKQITKIMVPFINADNFVWYSYDSTKDVLIRHMDSKEFIERETNSAIEVKNLIIQYVTGKSLNDNKGRRLLTMTGTGEAEFIIGGKYIKGTWERKDLDSQTFYKDQDGKEIVLKPGNTWIEVHPNTKKAKVE